MTCLPPHVLADHLAAALDAMAPRDCARLTNPDRALRRPALENMAELLAVRLDADQNGRLLACRDTLPIDFR